ncbi:MAG: HU family DNA-binding protein [Bacteroidaceae bacterium]|nr:HU family DNA-binding protein [Bacteroidaceae bacterium]
MNHKDFISVLSQRTGASTKVTQTLVNNLLAEMTSRFEEGESLQVQNFGTFEVKKKLERIVVNPTNGQRMLVPPKLALSFKPSLSLKDAVQEGGEG